MTFFLGIYICFLLCVGVWAAAQKAWLFGAVGTFHGPFPCAPESLNSMAEHNQRTSTHTARPRRVRYISWWTGFCGTRHQGEYISPLHFSHTWKLWIADAIHNFKCVKNSIRTYKTRGCSNILQTRVSKHIQFDMMSHHGVTGPSRTFGEL